MEGVGHKETFKLQGVAYVNLFTGERNKTSALYHMESTLAKTRYASRIHCRAYCSSHITHACVGSPSSDTSIDSSLVVATVGHKWPGRVLLSSLFGAHPRETPGFLPTLCFVLAPVPRAHVPGGKTCSKSMTQLTRSKSAHLIAPTALCAPVRELASETLSHEGSVP